MEVKNYVVNTLIIHENELKHEILDQNIVFTNFVNCIPELTTILVKIHCYLELMLVVYLKTHS